MKCCAVFCYSVAGVAQVAVVTSAPGRVAGIDCVDEAAGIVYYNGWEETPLARHLFTAKLDGGGETALTTGESANFAIYSDNCKTSVRTYTDANQPRNVAVHDDTGARKFWLEENKIAPGHPYAPYMASHLPWTYGQLDAADGTKLDYAIMKPALRRGQKAPAIVLVYGGPGAQTVSYGFGDFFAQMLADNGYVVFRLDNRGAANRGKKFEDTLYRAMGTTEVDDQAVGARFLKSLPYVDGDRIGVYGWSYGGYMTLKMLEADPGLYAAGISGAPVTRWELYDTHYTERYMGDPREVPEAYEKASAIPDATKIADPLLLIHGMADDNVVFENSSELIGVLQENNVPFEMMLYPGYTHRVSGEKIGPHVWNSIVRFLKSHGVTPPAAE